MNPYFTDTFSKIYPSHIKVYKYPKKSVRMPWKTAMLETVAESDLDTSLSTKNIEYLDLLTQKKKLNEQRSLERSKMKISDLLLSNNFDLWVTITFNCNDCPGNCTNTPCICTICYRHDIEFQKKRLSKWIHNYRNKYKKFKYLLVPELHKNGALHFHGVFYDFPDEHLVKATNRKTNRKLNNTYNIKDFQLGFTKIQKIKSKRKVSSYIKKYITKDMITFNGKKRYWHSTGLKQPKYTYNELTQNNPFMPVPTIWHHPKGYFSIYTYEVTMQPNILLLQ